MWHFLLLLVAFVASASGQNCSSVKTAGDKAKPSDATCVGGICPCSCTGSVCPPCPSPIPARCLTCCGYPECPCLGPFVREAESPQHRSGGKSGGSNNLDMAVSTVISAETGPMCSGINIKPHLVLIMSSCLSGKDFKNLYVAVSGKDKTGINTQAVKVRIVMPFGHGVSPVVLVLEKPTLEVESFLLGTGTVDTKNDWFIQKWQVMNEGMNYAPFSVKANTRKTCDTKDKKLICVTDDKKSPMHWNEIGTALYEVRDNKKAVFAIYPGYDLFDNVQTHQYLALEPFKAWLEDVIFNNP